mmetsp:Transcript_106033/g.269300  ORF Transcript_106033/g.269300 Transcript_106033/m.269300 type:complete len:208 (-) Transcript_106033:628-1251(-)
MLAAPILLGLVPQILPIFQLILAIIWHPCRRFLAPKVILCAAICLFIRRPFGVPLLQLILTIVQRRAHLGLAGGAYCNRLLGHLKIILLVFCRGRRLVCRGRCNVARGCRFFCRGVGAGGGVCIGQRLCLCQRHGRGMSRCLCQRGRRCCLRRRTQRLCRCFCCGQRLCRRRCRCFCRRRCQRRCRRRRGGRCATHEGPATTIILLA